MSDSNAKSIAPLAAFMALLLVSACGNRDKSSAEAAEAAAAHPAAPAAANSADSMPPVDCNPSLTPAQCAEARAALERDAQSLSADVSQGAAAQAERNKEIERQTPSPASAMAGECEQQRTMLAALKRAASQPSPGDQGAKADIAAETAKIEDFIARNCQ